MITLFMAALSVATPTTGDSSTPDPGFGGGTLADIGGFALLALLIIVVIAVVVKLQKGVEAMQGQAAEAEARFAEELAKIAKAKREEKEQRSSRPSTPEETNTEPAPEPAVAPPASALPISSASAVLRNPMARQKVESLQDLANNLYGLRIITDLEGRVTLPLPPEGLIYRLRRGGACLLLPRLENAETMEHFCKRFELVFILSASGEVLVMERKQSRIVDLTERSGTGLPKL